MKKFKKLIALAVAMAAFTASAISASAANSDKVKYFEMDEIESSYYLANNTIHYTELLNGFGKNVFTFSDVDKTMMEGNIVLSVDFTNLSGKTTKEKYRRLSDSDFLCEIADYMDGLYLKNTAGKFITEGKYPLTVNLNAPRGHVNVMMDTNYRVFNNFDFTNAHYVHNDNTKTDNLGLYYKINDLHVLPSYTIVLEEISNSSKRAQFTSEFYENRCNYYTKNAKGELGCMTTGNVTFQIPSQYRGKSFNAYINGRNVGKVTLPQNYSIHVSYTNY